MKDSIVFFDGVCNFCNCTINFIIKKDKKSAFHFSSLQSELGQKLLRENNLSGVSFETIYLIKKGKVFEKSDAIIQILQELEWIWWLSYLLKIIPRSFRNKAYDFIANHRHNLFDTKRKCLLPSDEVRNRFVS